MYRFRIQQFSAIRNFEVLCEEREFPLKVTLLHYSI